MDDPPPPPAPLAPPLRRVLSGYGGPETPLSLVIGLSAGAGALVILSPLLLWVLGARLRRLCRRWRRRGRAQILDDGEVEPSSPRSTSSWGSAGPIGRAKARLSSRSRTSTKELAELVEGENAADEEHTLLHSATAALQACLVAGDDGDGEGDGVLLGPLVDAFSTTLQSIVAPILGGGSVFAAVQKQCQQDMAMGARRAALTRTCTCTRTCTA